MAKHSTGYLNAGYLHFVMFIIHPVLSGAVLKGKIVVTNHSNSAFKHDDCANEYVDGITQMVACSAMCTLLYKQYPKLL